MVRALEGAERRDERDSFGRRRRRSTNPDDLTRTSALDARDRARCLEETYDAAESVIGVFVRALVGAEVIFEPQVMSTDGALHETFNDELRHWFKIWARRPEVTGEYTYHEGVRQHVRSKVRDGEVFQQYVEGLVPSLEHGSVVPLSLEHIEADVCPIGFSDPARGIVQGIQKNEWGRPVAYWMHRVAVKSGTARSMIRPEKRMPAERCIHDKHTTHFRQTRGMSVLAPVLGRFDDLQDIEENERVAARCAAAAIGTRTRGTVEDWVQPAADDDREEIVFEPGAIFDLDAGEDFKLHASNRPNNALIPFIAQQFRAIAGGTGATGSSISRDYSGSYSSQRQEMVEGYIGYGVMHADLCDAKLGPDWRRFVGALVKYRILTVPADVVLDTLFDVDIPRPPMPWIDPKKEADSLTTLVDAELESASHAMRLRGRNPTIVKQQIKADRKWRRDQGRAASAQPSSVESQTDSDDDEDADQ